MKNSKSSTFNTTKRDCSNIVDRMMTSRLISGSDDIVILMDKCDRNFDNMSKDDIDNAMRMLYEYAADILKTISSDKSEKKLWGDIMLMLDN